MPRQTYLAPLTLALTLVGAALLVLTAGAEIITAARGWLAGEAPLTNAITLLHVLVAAAPRCSAPL